MGYVLNCLALCAVLLSTACSSGTPVATPAPPLPIVTVPEGQSARTAASRGSMNWLEPTGAGKSWQENSTGRDQVEYEIKRAAQSLSTIDYPALSLPDFVTYTRALTIYPVDFTDFRGHPLTVEAFGTGTNGERWTLYAWQGPEIPQHPDRPQVYRWITTYALYDMNAGRVTLLLATIRGEVHE